MTDSSQGELIEREGDNTVAPTPCNSLGATLSVPIRRAQCECVKLVITPLLIREPQPVIEYDRSQAPHVYSPLSLVS